MIWQKHIQCLWSSLPERFCAPQLNAPFSLNIQSWLLKASIVVRYHRRSLAYWWHSFVNKYNSRLVCQSRESSIKQQVLGRILNQTKVSFTNMDRLNEHWPRITNHIILTGPALALIIKELRIKLCDIITYPYPRFSRTTIEWWVITSRRSTPVLLFIQAMFSINVC